MLKTTYLPTITGAGNQAPVIIDICYNRARVPPAYEALVAPVLSRRARSFHMGGDEGVVEISREERFYARCEGYLFIPAGCVHRVVEKLTAHGHTVEVRDHTRWTALLESDSQFFTRDDLYDVDRQFLSTPATSPRGQVLYGKHAEGVRQMALIAGLLPKANIVIVTTNNAQADQLCHELGQLIDGPVRRYPVISQAAPAQVYVCTTAHFPFCNSDLWHVAIFVGGRTVLVSEVYHRAQAMQYQLLYCVRSAREPLSASEQLRVETIVGPVVFPTTDARSPRVVMPLGPPVTADEATFPIDLKSSPLLRHKRLSIWRNDSRNTVIATVAKALASQNMAVLWENGLFLHESEDFLASSYRNARVVILVESTEHGRQFLDLLPDWQMVGMLPESDGRVPVPNSFHRTIVTELFLYEHGIDCDVLVRATGGKAPLLVSGFPCAAPQKATGPLLVDLVDDGDAGAIQDTRARARDYQRRGWTIDDSGRLLNSRDQIST